MRNIDDVQIHQSISIFVQHFWQKFQNYVQKDYGKKSKAGDSLMA
jgi:hypothetical protein